MSAWIEAQKDYASLIMSDLHDSRYLREKGLIPNVIELVGNCSNKLVLDVGTGTGWLYEHISPAKAHALDLVKAEHLPECVEFVQEDVHAMSYGSNTFDVIVASLLLMFCGDLRSVFRELWRVSRPKGSLVIALTHPYFYRTGEVKADGRFLLQNSLSAEQEFELRIGETVGPFRYFYRPLPVYFNSLIREGWEIEETRDWFIDMEDYACYLELGGTSNIPRTGAVPMYCFIKAVKR